MHSITNITQLNVTIAESEIYLFAPYSSDVSTRFSYFDLLDQLNIVSVEVWSHALLITIYFWTLLIAIKRLYCLARRTLRFRKRKNDPLFSQPVYYQVATHMLQMETCDYFRFRERYLSILMSVFAFLLITFFSCCITTSKVSKKSFFAYDTYEKILGNKSVQPVWIDHLFDHHWYRDAALGSQQRQLWDQSLRISEEAKANGESRPSLISPELDFLYSFGQYGLSQGFVLFINNVFYDLFVRTACFSIPTIPHANLKNLRYKTTKDTSLQMAYNVLPVSVHLKEKDALNFLARVFLEHSLFTGPFSQSIVEAIASVSPAPSHRNERYFECLQAHKFPEGEAETVALVPKNFSHLFYFFLAFCMVASVLLIYEKCTCKKNKVQGLPVSQ